MKHIKGLGGRWLRSCYSKSLDWQLSSLTETQTQAQSQGPRWFPCSWKSEKFREPWEETRSHPAHTPRKVLGAGKPNIPIWFTLILVLLSNRPNNILTSSHQYIKWSTSSLFFFSPQKKILRKYSAFEFKSGSGLQRSHYESLLKVHKTLLIVRLLEVKDFPKRPQLARSYFSYTRSYSLNGWMFVNKYHS